MDCLPIIREYSKKTLEHLLCQLKDVCLIAQESRKNFSADFPLHNRYFSNGDKPFVALRKMRGVALLNYDGRELAIDDEHLVFFDDNVRHSWVMKDCDLEIFYYLLSSGQQHARFGKTW